MDVYWLEQTEADMPQEDDWLAPGEAARLAAMRFPKRRTDWRLGRWTAKRAVSACLNTFTDAPALRHIEINSAASGAPEVFFFGLQVPISLSLSHRAGTAACAVGLFDAALGCDLERVETRSEAFVADYFNPREQALIAGAPAADRPLLSNLLWSAKESALKALREGLRRDTRSVTVSLVNFQAGRDDQDWHPLRVVANTGEIYAGWWRHGDGLVRTLVAPPPLSSPILLLPNLASAPVGSPFVRPPDFPAVGGPART